MPRRATNALASVIISLLVLGACSGPGVGGVKPIVGEFSPKVVQTSQGLAVGDSLRVGCAGQIAVRPSSSQEVVIFCEGGQTATTAPTTATVTLTPSRTPTPTSTPSRTPTRTPVVSTPTNTPAPASAGIWLSPVEIAALPTSGAAWNSVQSAANGSWGSPNLGDNNSNHDTLTLAGALVYARQHDPAMGTKVINALMSAIGTENNGRSLETSRNITSYVIAADLINFRVLDPSHEATWRAWLTTLRNKELDGRSIVSTQEDRPNNWGTMASAARIAIDRYLGDTVDLGRAATVFHGWLGDRTSYAGFEYGELDWQCNPSIPVGINPVDCTKEGHNIDGVLPDDQRRTGGWTWPAPKGTYPHEALQGAFVAAELLTRAGYPAWDWEDKALRRAYVWLYTTNNNPATGDDSGYPFLVNRAYGTTFAPGGDPFRSGKNMCCLAWTHGS